jgi:hypothetical protein
MYLNLNIPKFTYTNFCCNDDLDEVYSMLLEKAYAKLHGMYIDLYVTYVIIAPTLEPSPLIHPPSPKHNPLTPCNIHIRSYEDLAYELINKHNIPLYLYVPPNPSLKPL